MFIFLRDYRSLRFFTNIIETKAISVGSAPKPSVNDSSNEPLGHFLVKRMENRYFKTDRRKRGCLQTRSRSGFSEKQ